MSPRNSDNFSGGHLRIYMSTAARRVFGERRQLIVIRVGPNLKRRLLVLSGRRHVSLTLAASDLVEGAVVSGSVITSSTVADSIRRTMDEELVKLGIVDLDGTQLKTTEGQTS